MKSKIAMDALDSRPKFQINCNSIITLKHLALCSATIKVGILSNEQASEFARKDGSSHIDEAKTLLRNGGEYLDR